MTLATAVVGGGAVSAVHLSALAAHRDVDLRAVCDADESRAGDRASEYDLRAYGDFEGMLALESLDWLHVCTPVDTHVELARMALEDDLAIQIESPMTDAASQAEELSALVADRDARVSVVHDGAFDPAIVEATSMLREGTVGDLRAVDLLYTGAPHPNATAGRDWVGDLPGGAFEEHLAGPIAQVLRLGGYPASVDAIDATATRHEPGDDGFAFDGATFQYTTADGVHCSATMVASDVSQRILRVHGDRGCLLVDLTDGTVTQQGQSHEDSVVTSVLGAAGSALARLRETATQAAGVARSTNDDGSPTVGRRDPRVVQIDREARALAADEPLPVPLSAGVWEAHALQAIRDDAKPADRTVPVAAELDPA